jgi:hypothetical protein
MTQARLPLALGVLFIIIYMGCGLAFHVQAPRLFRHMDQVFDADIPARIIDLTRHQGPHDRTPFHPLFVLLLTPLGMAVRGVLQGAGVDDAGRLAAILLSATAGGLTVAGFAALLRRGGLGPWFVLLWSLVFGLSTSQVVFASLPESWAFSALSLVVLFGLGARPQPPRDRLLAAGTVAFGMAATNLGAALVVRARWLGGQRWWKALQTLTVYALLVMAVTAALATVQRWLFPATTSFVEVRSLARDDRKSFVWPEGPVDLAFRTSELGANVLVYDVAAPRLQQLYSGAFGTAVDFPVPSLQALRPAGLAHLALWSAVLLACVIGALRGRLDRDGLPRALAAWVLGNVAFHIVFGTSLFLYSCQWTFAVVALAALAMERSCARHPPLRPVMTGALVGLISLQLACNLGLVRDLLAVFGRAA